MLKIILYVVAVLILGAALAPVLYNVGKGLAETTADKQTALPIKWLAAAADRSDFPRFFDRAVLLAGLILLFPLLSLLKMGHGRGRFRDTPWSLRLPDNEAILDYGQPLQRNPHGVAQMFSGFVIASGLLLLSGWLMVAAGLFTWKDAPASAQGVKNRFVEEIHWGKAVKKALPVAAVVSIMEEVIFRGILLGIFMRAMRPRTAIISLSLLFAFLHFLEPPPGIDVSDPDSSKAGFVMLGQIFQRYADPMSLLSRFAVLAAAGAVLASARYRTASLWLPIGVHSGWIFGSILFKAAVWPVRLKHWPEDLRPLIQWLSGETMSEGLLPLSVVIVTGFLIQLMTRRDPDESF